MLIFRVSLNYQINLRSLVKLTSSCETLQSFIMIEAFVVSFNSGIKTDGCDKGIAKYL